MKEIRIQTRPEEAVQRWIITVSLHCRSQLEPWRRKFCWRGHQRTNGGRQTLSSPFFYSPISRFDFLYPSPSGRWPCRSVRNAVGSAPLAMQSSGREQSGSQGQDAQDWPRGKKQKRKQKLKTAFHCPREYMGHSLYWVFQKIWVFP